MPVCQVVLGKQLPQSYMDIIEIGEKSKETKAKYIVSQLRSHKNLDMMNRMDRIM